MQHVVGAAIIRNGRVLAARRTSPPESAGKWEFPGGKVEAGESMESALAREIHEELSCDVVVVDWLPGSVSIAAELTLMVAQATVVAGEPATSTDHDALMWLGADELADVPWLDSDLTFMESVRERLMSDARLGLAP